MNAYVIETARLRENIRICREQMDGVKIYAVVKGDGYGLDMLPFSRLLREEGITSFAVTETDAVEALRADGFTGDILMLRVCAEPRELKRLLAADAVCSVGSVRSWELLDRAASELGKRARAQLYIDSGMGREGFSPRERSRVCALCRRPGAVTITGVYTHFPCAGGREADTRRRFAAFMELVGDMKRIGWTGEVHCANSCASLRFPEMRLDAVRIGSALLGRVDYEGAAALGLRPVGHIEAGVTAVRSLARGETVGYGSAFRARRPMRIAVLEIGYYHGYDTERCRDLCRPVDYIRAALSPLRALFCGSRRTALLDGAPVRVLGKVAMQNVILDVTDVPCELGDRAVLSCCPLLVRNLPREYR